ncbi:MAG: hypothetical protein QOJ11_1781 [Frankiales bacterium]|nr:hypothetical protein [Frankiales bacterium]
MTTAPGKRSATTANSPADRLILAALRAHGPSTRAEIASLADLSKSTVNEHVHFLIRRNEVVVRPPALSGNRGRPAMVVELRDEDGLTLALLLSHGEGVSQGPVQCAVITPARAVASFHVLACGSRPVQRGIKELQRMLAKEGLSESPVSSAVLGVPLPLELSHAARPEPVGPQNQVIAGMAHLLGSRPQDAMTRAFGVPARLGNDADLAALGEATRGAGVGVADLAYIKCLSGIGVGVVRRGQLLTGGHVTAGETEHVQVDGGVACVCGAPSCSGGGTPRALWAQLHEWGAQSSSMAELLEATAADDPPTLEALRRYGKALGRRLANIHLVFQPSLLVLEAGLGAAYAPLATGLLEGVGLDVPSWARVAVRVAEAKGLPSPEVCGAAAAAGVELWSAV